MKYLIVGLGNIGDEYKNTRHNIGFEVVNHLIEANSLKEGVEKFSIISHFLYRGKKIYLAKPTLYMNNSGRTVKFCLEKYGISVSNLLVIYDDISLPLGQIKLKPQGSSAGHNGLKSIEAWLNTTQYARLKIGIGNNFARGHLSQYVLGKFKVDEIEKVNCSVEKASDIALSFVYEGIENAMNKFN